MRRVRLMVGGVLMGLILGALAVWTGPGGMRRGGDPLIAGTRQVCEAILADDAAQWETVRRQYFTGEGTPADLLKSAKAQSLLFREGSRIVRLRRSADGTAGDRRMVAVECLTRTPSGDRTLTLHWERERGEKWDLTDLLSTGVTEDSASPKSLPAAVTTAAGGKSKPQPQAH